MKYRVFSRAWWTKDAKGNIIPHSRARKTHLAYVETEDDAREWCKYWNDKKHYPLWKSIKAEYESI